MRKNTVRSLLLLVSASVLSACVDVRHQQVADDEAAVVLGSGVRTNRTPLDLAYKCYGRLMAVAGTRALSVGVGEVRDYTGKYSDIEGSKITQGASPMVFSALFKLGDVVQVHERFDTRVAELELAMLEKRRLGTGQPHQIDGQTVPWMPYFGGSILKSSYYIVGGITELNYNIQSGGAEFRIGQTGPKARTYTMSVAADLRLVNTETLVVESAVSVQKQITGYEVGFDMFRFFGDGSGSNLVDISAGTKNQEPLQLGVRSVLELGTLQLIHAVSGVEVDPCLPADWRIPSDDDIIAFEEAHRIETASITEENTAEPDELRVTQIGHRFTSRVMRVRVLTSGPVKYLASAKGNDIELLIAGATTDQVIVPELSENRAVSDIEVTNRDGNAALIWRGREPLVTVARRVLDPAYDGSDGVELTIMRKSVLAAVKAAKDDCGCEADKKDGGKTLKLSSVGEPVEATGAVAKDREVSARKVALSGAPALRLVE
jgi:curli biogenesis system outer membrane secretion channel CsgG